MAYPIPTDDDRAFYLEHGWFRVEEAVDLEATADLVERTRCVIERPGELAFDPSTLEVGESGKRCEPVLVGTLDMIWPEWRQSAFHEWTARFAAALAGRELDFWYNQLLFKPPHVGAVTHWHQDEASLGATEDLVISSWLALEEVTPESGCLEFFDGGQRDGILEALRPTKGTYGLESWDADPKRIVKAPLPAGGVTFHHGKMPHRSSGNRSDRWRLALIQRFTFTGVEIPAAHSWQEGPKA